MSIKKNGIYWKGIKRRIGKFFEKVHECILIFTDWLGYVHIVDRLQNIEIIDGNRKNFTPPLAGIGCRGALQVRLRL